MRDLRELRRTAVQNKFLLVGSAIALLSLVIVFAFYSSDQLLNSTKEYSTTSKPLVRAKYKDGKKCVYSPLRLDRSGSVILDMLQAHAYIETHYDNSKYTYCGACGPNEHLHDIRKIIDSVGMQDFLRIFENVNSLRCWYTWWTKLYKKNLLDFTDEVREDLRKKLPYYEALRQKRNSSFSEKVITVHVRRGDVDRKERGPPNILWYHLGPLKYLPNSYYLRYINEYLKVYPGARVIVFSESVSEEPFDDFEKCGYEVRLDTPLQEIYKEIIMSDAIILSKGSFSLVPAILSYADVTIPKFFWYEPIPGWKVGYEYD